MMNLDGAQHKWKDFAQSHFLQALDTSPSQRGGIILISADKFCLLEVNAAVYWLLHSWLPAFSLHSVSYFMRHDFVLITLLHWNYRIVYRYWKDAKVINVLSKWMTPNADVKDQNLQSCSSGFKQNKCDHTTPSGGRSKWSVVTPNFHVLGF